MKAPILTLLALAGVCTLVQAQQASAGDASRGAGKAAMCIGCHGIVGYRASFPEVYRVPMISGQSAAYIGQALVAYQRGDRKHPSMRAIAGSLTEQDIADLSVYYEQHGRGGAPVPEQPAALPDALKDRMAACTACHGVNFSKPIDANTPRLAGQHADYLHAALRSYVIDGRAVLGRSSAVMRSQLVQDDNGRPKPTFTPAELKQVAAYIAALPGEVKTVPQPGRR